MIDKERFANKVWIVAKKSTAHKPNILMITNSEPEANKFVFEYNSKTNWPSYENVKKFSIEQYAEHCYECGRELERDLHYDD